MSACGRCQHMGSICTQIVSEHRWQLTWVVPGHGWHAQAHGRCLNPWVYACTQVTRLLIVLLGHRWWQNKGGVQSCLDGEGMPAHGWHLDTFFSSTWAVLAHGGGPDHGGVSRHADSDGTQWHISVHSVRLGPWRAMTQGGVPGHAGSASAQQRVRTQMVTA